MNWVQPKFTDFLAPPTKKQKFDWNYDLLSQNNVVSEPEEDRKSSWKPRKSSDLVVNKKKIEEVKSWIVNCKKDINSCVLLLTGPPGCGKLTTLKLLCSELKVNLVEWSPQVAQRTYNPENGEFYQSVSSLFEEFIVRATRYSNVLNSMSSRLIVIKDIPNCYIKDNGAFHELLTRYTKVPEVYLAFILSDMLVARSLFPDIIKNTVNVTTVNFNPIIQKGVKEVLKKHFRNVNLTYLNSISLSCNGDLRNAIATYEFVSSGSQGVSTKPRKTGKLGCNVGDKSDFVDIFHGLGRVLYSKREDDGKLVHNPVDVGEAFVSSPELFLGMLQENYLHTFSSVHDISKASDSLSTADMLLNDFKDTSNSRTLSLIVASFGVMAPNSLPVKKFLQLNKPKKLTNVLSEYRTKFSDTNVLLDVVAYGKMIPSFSKENSDLFLHTSAFT